MLKNRYLIIPEVSNFSILHDLLLYLRIPAVKMFWEFLQGYASSMMCVILQNKANVLTNIKELKATRPMTYCYIFGSFKFSLGQTK